MIEPNNDQAAPYWVLVANSHRPGDAKFYSGAPTAADAQELAAFKNKEEEQLYEERRQEREFFQSRKPVAKYSYHLALNPNAQAAL